MDVVSLSVTPSDDRLRRQDGMSRWLKCKCGLSLVSQHRTIPANSQCSESAQSQKGARQTLGGPADRLSLSI